MFPFWNLAIAPLFDAVKPRRVVEIGALRGETTVLMLERLGPECELHVIDPVPAFDPSDHEKQFPGRYVFHRALSHDILDELPPMDVALIDGDHNWYTVYHELRMLSAVARRSAASLPLMIMHDVGWPYGRRDLYYAPETIPEEFRQEYAQAGMVMGRKNLVKGKGGINPTMYNAVEEGGPRNGVMTALDDFVAEYDKPLRVMVLPIYWGLALVAEEEYLAARPEVARVFDWLESSEGRGELLDLAEETRLSATLTQHNVFFQRERQQERSANLYLGLLKASLLDEHYLENELRIDQLAIAVAGGTKPNPQKLVDPRNEMPLKFNRLLKARRAGKLDGETSERCSYLAYTTMGRTRLDRLHEILDTTRTESVDGDLVDCGTGKGGGAIFMRGYLEAYGTKAKKVWVADPFRAAGDPTSSSAGAPNVLSGSPGLPPLQPDLNIVRSGFAAFELLDNQVAFLQGTFADTLPDAPIEKIALLRVGGDMSDGSADALDALYDRVAIGGYIFVDDYATPTRQQAVDEFRERRGVDEPIEMVDWNAASWRKTHHPTGPSRSVANGSPKRAPLAPAAPTARKDLSVVVVFYNMQREARRTLHSLSRSYQQDIADLDYEVLVIENGSDEGQKLGEDFVRSQGPEFRYVDMEDAATPSPVGALNRGVELGGGDAFALMIDGAHVLTPRVLHYGMKGLRAYQPSIVLTQQWYVGPGQQPEMVANGYDTTLEDGLFAEISWPRDGYGLFDIGHFIGDRDWLDGQWESNCIFIPRQLMQQYGAFDEGFSVPGGGYANLDLYERLGSAPNVDVVTILGEGSFHQVHGGTTTNVADAEERSRQILSYADSYSAVRGKRYAGPNKALRYVGSMTPAALRTRARRQIAPHFWKARDPEQGGPPDKPSPLPSELREQFVEATWESLSWRGTRWLGRAVPRLPTDLFIYQEIVASIRPDWIIETGTRSGGRALFLASICDLIDHGHVLTIGSNANDDRPEHPRISYLNGQPLDEDVLHQVGDRVGPDAHGLVILGIPASAARVVAEFDAYCGFVSEGSYVIVEDTIVNGHPVWPSFGPGPMEAVKQITNRRANFAPDPTMEKFGITFNPHGFLKRVR